MTTQQPDALRLADMIEACWAPGSYPAAAELRRLHDEVQQLKSDLSEEVLISNAMLEVKDELLAALKDLLAETGGLNRSVRAAIAKAERTTT